MLWVTSIRLDRAIIYNFQSSKYNIKEVKGLMVAMVIIG